MDARTSHVLAHGADAPPRPPHAYTCSSMLDDMRYALRLFARRPGVTALIVATLAIGIAASTVVFSVADAILWHPLPFHDPDQPCITHNVGSPT